MTAFRATAAGVLLMLATLAAAAPPQLLLPGPQAAPGRGTAGIPGRGHAVRFNAAQMFGLSHRAEVELTLPDGARHPYVFDFAETRPGGIATWVGRHRDKGAAHRAIVTQGPAGAFGYFSTPDGEFRLMPADGQDVLVDMELEAAGVPPIDLGGDALPPPPGAKGGLAPDATARTFAALPGINSAFPKSTPSPVHEIDLMIVYSRGVATTLGDNLMTRFEFMVARANAAFEDSEIAVRLRLVRAALVDYPDNRTTLEAISAITPSCTSPTTCNPPADPAFRDVEPMRQRVGADMVAFLRGTNGFGGDGRAWLGGDPPWPGSMYSVTTGCLLACEWVFIHELGHNLGVHHDRPTVAQQSGGTSTYFGGAYSYSFGYAYCSSGTLTCNPFIPPASGGCFGTPECTTFGGDNFGDVMAYFGGTTMKNYKFSNPAVRCVGSSGVEGPCGVVETDPMSANGALTINNLRAKISALRATVDPMPPPPSLLRFEPDAYLAPPVAADVVLTVGRKEGSSGTVQVRYRTRDGDARAGVDYTAADALLSWADGDASPKQIRIPVLGGTATAGRNFYVDLLEPTGTAEVYLTYPTNAVVAVLTPWPANGAMPAGFVEGGLSSAPWTVASDHAYEGQYSLRSGQVFGNGTSQRSSQVNFSGQFTGGDVVFAYRVSTYGASRSALRFAVDGIVQLEVGGETGWRVHRHPITAGSHGLQWIVYNYDPSPCSTLSGAAGGASCADFAWIDAASMPLVSNQASVTLASSPNPSTVGAPVTFTAQLSGPGGTPTGAVSFREGTETIPRCSAVTIESGRAVCETDVLAAGSHSIFAVYLGDSTYPAGPQASVTQTVNGTRAAQSITFDAPADRSADSGSFLVQASASSGLPVAFNTPSATICTVDGATVKLRGLGRCTLRANQDGNAGYLPAAPVERSFMVTAATGLATDARAVPTYESAGLYWSDPGASVAPGCDMRFRRAGDSAWTPGLALWFDAAGNECRGSLVHLAAGTEYEVELGLPGHMPLRKLMVRTWSNQKPVAATIDVPGGSATLDVTQGGTPSGYVVYQAAAGSVLDAANASAYNVTVNASYVIVRGFTLRGAQQDAIRIAANVSDVIIEDNDIAGWGRAREAGLGVDMDSAIRAVCPQPTLERVTIQRNTIHDPRFGANSWSDGHPLGPQAITFSHCGGNHVIRHNEISSTPGHYYNDIIGGEDNFTTTGFPNHDSDLYGNLLSNAWDDAIEAEGGNRNVRVWGNYIDNTTTGIATALTSVGPFYAFRNVYNRSRELEKSPLDADLRQEIFKAGSDPGFADGRRYFFHNSTLQARQAGANMPLGAAFGISGSGATQPFNNVVSRNNIYHTWDDSVIVHRQPGVDNEFRRDMYNGVANVPIIEGVHASPAYAPGHGWQSEAGGRYALAAGTPGHDGGVRIANFNDDFRGSAPDIGAGEADAPPMAFGLAASPGPSVVVGPAPLGRAVLSPAALDFGGQSMGTTSPPLALTLTNVGGAPLAIGEIQGPAQFSQANDCGAPLPPGAHCTIAVTFAPSPAAGALNASIAIGGALTVANDGSSGPASAQLSGAAEKSFVSHYYRSILRRAPDDAGKAFWQGEAARLAALEADINEAWFSLAMRFFTSAEYAALQRDDGGFATDLYRTFFNRPPDASGLAYWTGQMRDGMPREVLLAAFMMSPEFRAFTEQIFGNARARAEIDMVMDFYRGLLGRLPDGEGFDYWVKRFRAAQCQGPGPVSGEADAISSLFVYSGEYANRGRADAQFVGDLYNAFLRRGGDLEGVRYWIAELGSGRKSREDVRLAFEASPEFQGRVRSIVEAGCRP